ncbi:MAG: hypothetical protein F4X03_01540 [Dehalococcoidia bacterium]|nr:hypothetical protein [Dehalococcoidia bacterium]
MGGGDGFGKILAAALEIEKQHSQVLSEVDTARTRIVTIESLYGQMRGLTQDQKAFLEMAIKAIKCEINRAAIILAWAALIERVQQIHDDDRYKAVKEVRPKWKVESLEDVRESVSEYQLIEATKESKFISKNQMKTLHGLLNTRNMAAHPGPFNDSFNKTLGYVEDVLSELNDLVGKP